MGNIHNTMQLRSQSNRLYVGLARGQYPGHGQKSRSEPRGAECGKVRGDHDGRPRSLHVLEQPGTTTPTAEDEADSIGPDIPLNSSCKESLSRSLCGPDFTLKTDSRAHDYLTDPQMPLGRESLYLESAPATRSRHSPQDTLSRPRRP